MTRLLNSESIMVYFAKDSLFIDSMCKSELKERSSFKMKVVFKNTGLFGVTLALLLGGAGVGVDRVIKGRKLAHACPDLKNEIKLIESIAGNAQKLKIALKQMVFDQKNGH